MHDGITTGKLFINGVLDTNINKSGVPNSLTEDISIGAYTNMTWSLDAILDDLRIYATALSDADVLSLYRKRINIDKTGNVQLGYSKEKQNILYYPNEAINSKLYINGLSNYTQQHCLVTLTDQGYRIYRTPNKNYPADGSVM